MINVTVSLNDIDDLEFVLSTSKTVYTSANNGDWIAITEEEYNDLATALNEVATAGLNDAIFEGDIDLLGNGANGYTIGTENLSDTSLSVQEGAYVFAFKYTNQSTIERDSDQVKVNTSTDVSASTFSDLGGTLPAHIGQGVQYFVLKGNTVTNSEDGVIGFYSSSTMGHKIITGYTTYNGGRENSNTLTSDPENIIYQYQALTTTQKQW